MRDVLDIHIRYGAHAVTLYVAVHQRGRMPANRADLALVLDIAPSSVDSLVRTLTESGTLQLDTGHDGSWLLPGEREARA